MAVYTNIKCPYCGSSYTKGYTASSGIGSRLGVPFIRCSKCKKLSSTGRFPWSQLNGAGRFIEIIRGVFLTIYGGLIYGVLCGIAYGLFSHYYLKKSWEPSLYETIALVVLGEIISTIRSIMMYKNGIQRIEEITRQERWDEPEMFL